MNTQDSIQYTRSYVIEQLCAANARLNAAIEGAKCSDYFWTIGAIQAEFSIIAERLTDATDEDFDREADQVCLYGVAYLLKFRELLDSGSSSFRTVYNGCFAQYFEFFGMWLEEALAPRDRLPLKVISGYPSRQATADWGYNIGVIIMNTEPSLHDLAYRYDRDGAILGTNAHIIDAVCQHFIMLVGKFTSPPKVFDNADLSFYLSLGLIMLEQYSDCLADICSNLEEGRLKEILRLILDQLEMAQYRAWNTADETSYGALTSG